jgi:hypothetical protein
LPKFGNPRWRMSNSASGIISECCWNHVFHDGAQKYPRSDKRGYTCSEGIITPFTQNSHSFHTETSPSRPSWALTFYSPILFPCPVKMIAAGFTCRSSALRLLDCQRNCIRVCDRVIGSTDCVWDDDHPAG